MQRIAAFLTMLVFLAVGCGAADDDAEEPNASAPATSEVAPSTSVVQMSIPDLTTPSSTPADPNGASGEIIMLKLHVDDIDVGEAFYTTVFGATRAIELGDGIRVMTMTDGPGFILIEDDPDEADAWNAQFLIQVPELDEAEALAVDNGATHQQSFEGAPGGQEAASVDLLDPWGNQIEILQLG